VLRRVALILWMSGAHDRGVLAGIAQYIRGHDPWSLVIAADWLRHPRGIRSWDGDGLIAHVNSPQIARAIGRLSMPVVNICEAIQHVAAPAVLTDNEAVGRLAAEHFLQRSFTHFAYWGPTSVHTYRQRGLAFERALSESGFGCTWAGPELDPFDLNVPPPGLPTWIRSLPKPVAVFTCGDMNGRHVVDTCRRCGVRVPEEVAVVGVDNDELLCELAAVQLSSVAVPTQKKGYEAARMLDRLIHGESVQTPVIIQPTHVVTRHSSDIQATDDPLVGQTMRLIFEHAGDPIDVGYLLDKLCVSRRTLERRFQVAIGRSPAEEIRRVHVERAKRLLEQTQLSITEVAGASGFTDINRLGAAFRQHVGTTPSAYREQWSLH